MTTTDTLPADDVQVSGGFPKPADGSKTFTPAEWQDLGVMGQRRAKRAGCNVQATAAHDGNDDDGPTPPLRFSQSSGPRQSRTL